MRDRPPAPASPGPTCLLATGLKQATENVHLRLHHHPMLVQLHQTSLSADTYQRVLRAFHAFYSIWEPRIVRIRLEFAHEAKPLEWLEQDFAALDLPLPQYTAQAGPESAVMTMSQAIGYLYVKQGSTLGGQRISRHIQQQLGLKPGHGQFFFHGFGKRTGPCWKAFLEFLAQAEARDRIDLTDAAASAVGAFESLEAILNQHQLKTG